MLVAVGADQISQHVSVARVGLGARGGMTVPVAGHRQGVDSEHHVAGRHQRRHPQSPVGFDAHHHLGRVLGVLGDQSVQHAHPDHALR